MEEKSGDGGWFGFFLPRNWTYDRKRSETSSNWIHDISAPMIRFNQIAWPDIALLFDSRGRNARTTHFTACPCVCVCVCVFFFSRIRGNGRTSFSSAKRFEASLEFYWIPRNSTVYLFRRATMGKKGGMWKKLSLVTRGWSEFPVEGVTRLL